MSNYVKLLSPTELLCHVMRGPDLRLYHKAVRGYTSLNLGDVLPASLKKRQDTIFPLLIGKGQAFLREPEDLEN
jgi:hypothetical protein